MKIIHRLLVCVLAAALLPGCASIVSKSSWPFSVQTEPSGAQVSITNKKGIEIFTGRTPTLAKLKSGAGFFAKESYIVLLTMDGYEQKKINVECKLNGWYFGNILLGGVIGMLIVDPATGAMYRLDNDGVYETMTAKTATSSIKPSLKILDKNQIPASWASRLVKIN